MPFADHDGIRLRYTTEGEGPPILMHHIGMSRLEDWYALGYVEQLAKDFRLLLFDARGHGESDKPTSPEAFGAEQMVGDVVTVLDAAGIDSAHYFGYSMGAKVGWAAASIAPDRFDSWIIGGADPYASDQSAQRMIDLLRKRDMEVVADALSETFTIPDFYRRTLLQNDPEVLEAYFGSSWPDLGGVTSEIDAPTLLFVGENDAVVDGVRQAADEIADARLVVVPEGDHLSVLLDTDAVVREVRRFIASQ